MIQRVFMITFVILSVWIGQSNAAKIDQGRLLITGSSTMCPLIAEIGRRFESLHPDITIQVQCGGSSRGISDAKEGKADIGMASRALAENEKNLYGFPIARDGISIIVHKNNPINFLSSVQIAGIYTGKITNWKKLGGRDANIVVINPKEGYSSVELFAHYFKIDYAEIRAAIIAGDNPTRIKAVVENPDAIAYISAGEADRMVLVGAPIKPLPFNNVMPTGRNIITGNYPIIRPLNLVAKQLPKGMARAFIEFCLSPAVTDLIEKFDFVPYED